MTTAQFRPWMLDSARAHTDDRDELDWVSGHRLYCLAVVAIIVATLVGAVWADQPRGRVGSSPSPAAAIDAGPAFDR